MKGKQEKEKRERYTQWYVINSALCSSSVSCYPERDLCFAISFLDSLFILTAN